MPPLSKSLLERIVLGLSLLSPGGIPHELGARAGYAPAARRSVLAEPRAEQLRAEGILHYRERRYFQALKAFEEARKLVRPEESTDLEELIARTRSALGVELFNSGEIRQASRLFREALEATEDAYAHFGLGFVHFVKLEDEDAARHLEAALRLEPGHGKTHKLLALLSYRQGRTREALAGMGKALELEPTDREARAILDRWTLESRVTRRFTEQPRAHLLLRVDPALSAARVAEVAERLERARAQIADSFQLELTQRVVVVLFDSETFYRATGSFHWVGGFYDGQVKLPVEGGETPGADDLAALDEAVRHEMTHVVVRAICPECPNWLNEGIAQHFERPGRGSSVAAELRSRAARRIRFEDVPARLWEVDDEELARQTYRQGLGFVEFLIGRYHEFRLRLLLESLHEEGSLKKAFERTYGVELDEAEALWWDEVERGGEAAPGSSAGSGG